MEGFGLEVFNIAGVLGLKLRFPIAFFENAGMILLSSVFE